MSEIRMPDINNVTIAGNLTRDPTFRKTTNGTPVTNFWIASNRKFKDNNGQWRENVCYVGVVAWYKLAETCAENLQRGNAVIVEGELQSRSVRFENGRKRNIVEIKARRIQFLNKKESDSDRADFSEDVDTEKFNNENSQEHENSQSDDYSSLSEQNHQDTQNDQSSEDHAMKGKFDFGYQDIEI